ncbi:cytochrome b [Colwellia sp. BRX10-3]|nr:cytochrome b [Colwellia sp. BRX10-3]MBA6390928.1 cytochrome b [Colwellia sp. BRX10-3]
MRFKMTSKQRYPFLSITLHWLMLLLLIAVYSCIEFRELYPKGSEPREALKTWHFMLGLSVFCLVWIRLLLRGTTYTPVITPSLPNWQKHSAKFMHSCLYLFMIIMPLAGWLILSAEGNIIPFWGLSLPSLVAENEALAKTIEELHETTGMVGYYLIGLHAVAALFHHYVQKDNTLIRMLPWLSSK